MSLDAFAARPGWYRGLDAKIHYAQDRRRPFLCNQRTDKSDSAVGGVKSWGRKVPKDYCAECWRTAREMAKRCGLVVTRSKAGRSQPDLPGQSLMWADA